MASWTNPPSSIVRTSTVASTGPWRAVVRPEALDLGVRRVLNTVDGALADWVQMVWSLSWSDPVPARLSGVITHPAVHLTVESGPVGEVRHGHLLPAELIHGVATERFSVDLPAPGWVVGLHLVPGAVFDLTGTPARTWTGRVVDWATEWPGWDLSGVWSAPDDPSARAEALEVAARTAIGDRRPSTGGLRARAVERLARTDRSIRGVGDLADRIAMSARSLQRLCRDHLGVTPGWLLRRARLLDAHQLLTETDLDVAEVAARLGWYDQAHLSRDYTRATGTPPTRLRHERRVTGTGQPTH